MLETAGVVWSGHCRDDPASGPPTSPNLSWPIFTQADSSPSGDLAVAPQRSAGTFKTVLASVPSPGDARTPALGATTRRDEFCLAYFDAELVPLQVGQNGPPPPARFPAIIHHPGTEAQCSLNLLVAEVTRTWL